VRVAFRLVDVFTEVPFAGNQLCVVPDTPQDLDPETMQVLAREIGFSETTFATVTGPATYRMRIFTPGGELPFAGHPTLGTSFTLVSEGRLSTSALQTTAAGDVPVEIDPDEGFGWMRQLPPEFGVEFTESALVAEAAGLSVDDLHIDLPVQVVSTGLGPLLVPLRDDDVLRRAVRVEAACATVVQRSGGECLYLRDPRGGRRPCSDVRRRVQHRGGPGDRSCGGSFGRVPGRTGVGRDARQRGGRPR
jgi:PhzF family phenazine biosynthesis protein